MHKIRSQILSTLNNEKDFLQILTDTFFCKFLYKWLSQFGIPIPGVNLKDLLSGLSKSLIHKFTVNKGQKMTE